MNKLIPLLAFSVLLLVPVGDQNVFAPGTTLELTVAGRGGVPLDGALCTISDPGLGIIVSGFTDTDGIFSTTLVANPGDIFEVECTKGSVSANESIIIGSNQNISVSLILDIIVGGKLIPIETTSLILAGA